MMSARLQMRQSQSLVLTPQLLQSIRLLQYSHAELEAFVEGEVERNPILERDPEPSADADGGETTSEAASGDIGADEDALGKGFDASAPVEREDRLASVRLAGGGVDGAGLRQAEALADIRPSLARHALAEIADAVRDPVEMRIGTMLAGCLDDAGWLDGDLSAIAGALGLGLPAVEAVLIRIQEAVEPAGLFARGLAECLAIQLRRRGRFDPVMRTVLGRLDLLARRDFASLRRLTGEDEAGLMDILAEIRRLDPKPGHGFETGASGTVVPDVVVEQASDGSWRVELNPQALPRVLVNEHYAASVAPACDREGQAFLSDCQASANWLVRSLDQRARTILKVTSEIVRRQDDFLVNGITGLKPMTLMAVAESIGMHESTVSRVTSNKYVATPRGTFEMKFFFTVAIAATGGGESHSAESVKHRIRTLVDTEAASAVLSDDDIADRLRRDGVDLARRTVAKYREALGIPSSIQRRRETNARRLAG